MLISTSRRSTYSSNARTWLTKTTAGASLFALTVSGFGAPAQAGADPDNAVDSIKTATPIKHVIIIVGENRSFDHLFATYLPQSKSKRKSEKVLNLLSEGIVNADGSPVRSFAKAHQFKIVSAPNGGKFCRPEYPRQRPAFAARRSISLWYGGTGLSFTEGPDTRITNVNNLLPGPFQMTGPTMPFDAFTGTEANLIASFDPIRVQISAPLMENQFRRSPVAAGHKRDLSVKHLEKVIASALRKDLDILSAPLHEKVIALPNNANSNGTQVVASDVAVVQLRIDAAGRWPGLP
ncbi:MAG TPA: hypothetical protein VHZ55_28735 [Bryobacteraceae bacterium]|jgi:hypothetical protein|nr:hypothetical protein [Bryobacteraceae bacterium]